MPIRTIHVTSGNYAIEQEKTSILQAFLGTCLGIVIFDRKNKIGGLIHILLSEPVSKLSTDYPEKYASTGIPIFIDKMINLGAEIENMTAYIAGGALVGPVSEQDMVLDIGGRTAEVANSILRKKGIKIEYSETGGFFSCCLELNLKNFICTIKPLSYDDKKEHSFKTPGQKEILKAVDKLQPIPQVALKILRLLNDEVYDIKKIASEVRQDQVISAKILKLCNSSYFSIRRKIESIDDAIIVLGLNQLVKVVITNSVKQYFSQSSSGYSLCKGGLFHHAIGSAAIAEMIAIKTKTVPSGIGYTAGLIHDIGIVVLDQYAKDVKPFFYRELQKDKNILTMEKELFGITHVQVGEKLAEKWNFSKLLTDSIRYHHYPENAFKDSKDLVNILYISDLIMTRFNAGINIGTIHTDDIEKKFNEIGLSIEQLPELVELIPTGDPLKLGEGLQSFKS
ncbi:MAG: HDOD domain-containing protein [Desulfobacterales bacterium]|nr:HDOD domain-containing protein [Desulfobacterales bacterium]MCP4161077.1 HDOD domain-containing protein [Deltaproteobacteria bacterium]